METPENNVVSRNTSPFSLANKMTNKYSSVMQPNRVIQTQGKSSSKYSNTILIGPTNNFFDKRSVSQCSTYTRKEQTMLEMIQTKLKANWKHIYRYLSSSDMENTGAATLK